VFSTGSFFLYIAGAVSENIQYTVISIQIELQGLCDRLLNTVRIWSQVHILLSQ